jgi:hypothetical protein
MNLKATLLALLGIAQAPAADAAPIAEPAGKTGPQLVTHSITAAEADARGLPGVGFSLSHESLMMWTPFPEPGVYVTLSGPPGGTLMLTVLPYQGKDEPGTLERHLRARAGKMRWQPLLFGKAERLALAGEQRHAIGFIANESHARARYCGVLVPTSPDAGLLVLIAHSVFQGDDTSCAATAAHPTLAPAMQSFRVLR